MLRLMATGGVFALVPALLLGAALLLALVQVFLAGRARLAIPIAILLGLAVALGLTGTGAQIIQALKDLPEIPKPEVARFLDRCVSVSGIATEVSLVGAGLVTLVWGAGAALHRTRRLKRGAR